MSLAEILKQVQALSSAERDELVNELIEMRKAPVEPSDEPEEHWGKSLNRLMNEIGPIELVDPHIEDPVEWLKVQRQKEADRLKSYWDGEK